MRQIKQHADLARFQNSEDRGNQNDSGLIAQYRPS